MTDRDHIDRGKTDEKVYFFDKPENVKRLLMVFYISCGLLFALDFVIHRHVIHEWEKLWGFYPIYGFLGCVLLVFIATGMRTFLMRSEDYYDKNKVSDDNAADNNDFDTQAGRNNVDD